MKRNSLQLNFIIEKYDNKRGKHENLLGLGVQQFIIQLKPIKKY